MANHGKEPFISALQPSPRIEHLSWGSIRVAGGAEYKDAMLFPGGARAWDWSKTGTRHDPGIQVTDVEELLAHGASVVILSQGVYRRLQVHPSTLKMLEARKIAYHQLPTEEAAELYNHLCDQGVAVAALMHTTC